MSGAAFGCVDSISKFEKQKDGRSCLTATDDMATQDKATVQGEWLGPFLRGALDPQARLPLYEQLAGLLTAAMRDDRLPPGTVLPPEPDLARLAGVSRQTVTRALTGLARHGLVTRRRGVGTFVSEPTIEQPLEGVYSFIRTLIAQGQQPGNRLLGSRITVEREASEFLTGRADAPVFEITRIRLVNGDPLVFEEVFLPIECGERITTAQFRDDVLYEAMESVCGLTVDHADETLRPVLIDTTEAALLGVAAGDPAFLVERFAYASRQPAEFRRSVIRGDRYQYRVQLGAASNPTQSDPDLAMGGLTDVDSRVDRRDGARPHR
jgi:GntR family transcriptional regulator